MAMIDIVKSHQIDFVVGVPDSRLKDDLEQLNSMPGVKHIIATDEGEAVGEATGYHLATGKKAMVYMQSDGFCNALNPITSLVIPYKIPMIFVISLREKLPQHEVMAEGIWRILYWLGNRIEVVLI